ncbi:MAG: tetratricopeptide repeat protein [Planctomycetes bacterium]|nr:tetratricopeptide repeat protein [Planctomycetota bacterium]
MKPSDLDQGVRKSKSLLARGKINEALARLMHLTEKYPGDEEVKRQIAEALNRRGLFHAEAGDIRRAETDFNQSLRYHENATAHINQGRVHQIRGEYAEAFSEYTRGLEIDEDLPEAHEYLGYYFLEVGDHEQAAVAFGRAIAKGRATKHIYLGLWEAYLQLERKEQAHETILEVARAHPDDDQILGTLGLSYAVCLGDYDQAEEAWKRAVQINPRNLSSMFNLSGLAALRGRREDALGYLRQCAEIDRSRTLLLWKEDLRSENRKFAAYAGDEDFLDVLGVTSSESKS